MQQQQMSHVDLALSEISKIKSSLSTKKKYHPMKEALLAFQNLLENNKKKGTQDIPRQEIQKLLVPAQNQLKSAKFHITLICFILKLINLKVINDIQTSEDILVYFLKIKDIQKEQLQVKLIQSFMTFIHPEFINFGNFAFVEKVFLLHQQCLTMVLYMKSSKNPIISSSAESSLYKVIELLSASSQLIIANRGSSFDNMEIQVELEEPQIQTKQDETTKSNDVLKQIINLVSILTDFISIADYQRPHWFPPNVPLDREFGLVSINSFLTNMGKFFGEYQQIQDLLMKLLETLKKLVQTPQNMIKGSILIETFKCFTILVDMNSVLFLEVWNIIIGFIKSQEHSIFKNLSYQCLIYFVQSQLFLDNLVKLKINEKNYLLDAITLISGLSKDTIVPSEAEQKKWSEFNNPTQNLQGEQELLSSDNAFVCRMLSEFQSRFANSLCVYADQHKIQLGQFIKLEDEVFGQLIDHTWKLNLRSVKYLLLKDLDELSIQNVLSSFQCYINIVGSIQMKQVQNAYIKTICEFCKPLQNEEFTRRHIQINKMVLNIANCLGNLLECSSWISILKTFEECENHYLRNRLAKNTSQEEQIKTLDISILFQSLDQLFTQSSTYENEHLINVMDAINSITIEQLENQQENESPKRKFNGETKRFFSLSKLIELIRHNLHRLDVFWELVMAHFISVVSSKNLLLVQCATDTLSQIVFLGFEYMTMFHKKGNLQGFIKEKWSKQDFTYQYTLFQPWIDLCTLRQNEVKDILLINVLKMLQNNGHEIFGRGWDGIILILLDISAEQTSAYVKSGLACAEYIINQFLGNIDCQQLSKLFDIIDNFKCNSIEQNINFQICNMLWHLGDFITKNHATILALDNFLPKIFYKLSLISYDSIPEIRHSAIHIFSNLLLHLNSEQQYLEWKKILEQIYMEMMHRIVHTYADKNAAKEQDAVQWEETVKSAFQAFIKLCKKYFLLIDESSQQKDDDTKIIIQLILPDMIIILQQNKPQLSLELAKEIRELFQYKPTICLQNFGPLLEQISNMFNSPNQDVNNSGKLVYLKTLILHITNEILELISDIIRNSSDLHLSKVIKIYYQILEFPIIAHLKFDLIQNKIFFEDNLAPKNVMLAIQSSIQKGSPTLIEYLIKNLRTLFQESPNNKFKHILIKRHIQQLNQILSNNLNCFFQFSELYENIIQMMRLNEADLHYTENLQEEKSIFMIVAEHYLQSAQKVNEQNEQLLKTLQNCLPSKKSLKTVLKGLGNTYKNFINENILIQNSYIEFIVTIYEQNIEFTKLDIFVEFINKLHELAQIKSLIALNPITILCTNKLNIEVTLPYLLNASISILEKGEIKLIIELLTHLQTLTIPVNSFAHFQPIEGDERVIKQDSILQSQHGHLYYLMPQLALCITHKDEEVRQQIQNVILLMSKVI